MDSPFQEAPPRQSLDSTASGSPTTTIRRRKTDQGSINPIEATVTKLLVATKQLLESLTSWSTRKMTEDQVSDIFVHLATQFNLASQSFHEAGIDTSELAHIPDDLRNCLETALGEEPSPASLEQYLPKIKEVIINLLQGLRQKQNVYREQNEAKARLNAINNSTRSRSSGSRQPSVIINGRATDSDTAGTVAGPRTSVVGPAVNSPATPSSGTLEEPSHAETLASLRKSDAITRRASSRRHSQRFSTLLEQNAPPVPRRHPNDPAMAAAYPGLPGSQSSTPSSPFLPTPNLVYSPTPNFESYSALPPSPSVRDSYNARTMQNMPQPPMVPIPQAPPSADSVASTVSPTNHFYPPSIAEAHEPKETVPTIVFPSDVTNPGPAVITSGATSTNSSINNLPVSASTPLTPITPTAEAPPEQGMTLFLQVGKSVKKTKVEGELTHSALHMLFMEKFQYNPGQDDFPTIYVKDPTTNIHYELESLSDVRQNGFLSLNVDDLEHIQRKMDQGFAALTKELQDIKKSQEVMEQARQKAATAAAAAAAAAASANVNNNSTSSLNNLGGNERNPAPGSTSAPEGASSQLLRSMVSKVMAKAKSSQPVQGKITADDLKPHMDEVQTLRRDLSVMRQLYTELQDETKTALGKLTTMASQMRKQALETPTNSARQFINSGKVKLDKKSEDLTNKIEEVQDVIEDMKVNITQRKGRPSESSLAFVDKQCEEITVEIQELSDFIQTLRPSWKKTWEVELQTIVKEQMFMKEQEALLEDLKEDRASSMQTLGNLKKLMELQSKAPPTLKQTFVPPAAPEEGFEGLKTVLEEVRMIAPDSDKRLKAMAQMEKLRHIELSNRIDEFEEELTTFVGASKLRKTGGALEVERQRQQRDLENLRAMFGTPPNSTGSPNNSGPVIVRTSSDGSATVAGGGDAHGAAAEVATNALTPAHHTGSSPVPGSGTSGETGTEGDDGLL